MSAFAFDEAGRLLVDDTAPITAGVGGLPFTDAGALAVAPGGVVRSLGQRGLAFDGAGRVVVTTIPGAARRTGRLLLGVAVALVVVGAATGAVLVSVLR